MLQVSLLLISFTCTAQERKSISDDLFYMEIEDSVFLITHVFPRYGSNSLFVLLPGDRGMLIDTPNETSGTRDLHKWIRKEFGNVHLTAINTGWHQDNLGGNEYLLSQNIPVYGPDLTANLIEQNAEDLRELILASIDTLEDPRFREAYRELGFPPPDHTFPIGEGLTLAAGGENFEVYFPGESHTMDNTVVYLHRKKILFGGCMILSMRHQRPGFTAHANMTEWPQSVRKVIQRFPGCRIVIPGHGPPGDASLLEHTVEILERYNKNNPD